VTGLLPTQPEKLSTDELHLQLKEAVNLVEIKYNQAEEQEFLHALCPVAEENVGAR